MGIRKRSDTFLSKRRQPFCQGAAIDDRYHILDCRNGQQTIIRLTSKIHKVLYIDHQQAFIEEFLLGCASGIGLGVLSMGPGGKIDQSGIENPFFGLFVVESGTTIISTIIGMNKGSREEYVINHKTPASVSTE